MEFRRVLFRSDSVHELSEFGVGVARIQSNPYATDRGRGEKGDEEIRPGDGQCGDPITTLCASGDKSARTVVDRVLEHRISQTRVSRNNRFGLSTLRCPSIKNIMVAWRCFSDVLLHPGTLEGK